jgi:hypothetical protein
LRNDDHLRALCLSGSIPIAEYIKALTDVGFGTIEIRGRRPYRILDTENYPTDELIFIESIEVCLILCQQMVLVYLRESTYTTVKKL